MAATAQLLAAMERDMDALLKYRRGGVGIILLDGPAATMDGTLWFEGGPMTGPSGTAWHLVEYLRFTLLHRVGFAGFGLPDAFSMLPVDEAVIRQLTQELVSF